MPRSITRSVGSSYAPPGVEDDESMISLDLDDHKTPQTNSNQERYKTDSESEFESIDEQHHDDSTDHENSTPRSGAKPRGVRNRHRISRSGVRFEQPIVPVNKFGPRPHHTEPSQKGPDISISYRPQPLPPRQSYSAHRVHPRNYAESEPDETSDHIRRQMPPPASHTSYPHPSVSHGHQQPQQPQQPQQYQHYHPQQHDYLQPPQYPQSNSFAASHPPPVYSSYPHQPYFQSSMWPYSYATPYALHGAPPLSTPYGLHGAAPPSVSSSSVSPPPSRGAQDVAAVDIEKIRIEAQLQVMRAMEHKTKAAEEQKEFEVRIRKEAEEKVQKRLEAMRHAEEEARKKAAKMKSDAEKVAREELQAERRAQVERERLAAIDAKRLEDDMRIKLERERLTEVAIREARVRQSEEFERLAREKMLQSVEEIADLAKEKMLMDLGLEREIVENPSEKMVLSGMGKHRMQASNTALGESQTTGEEDAVWQRSERTHSMTGSSSRHRNTRSVHRPPNLPRRRAAEEQRDQRSDTRIHTPQASQRSSTFSVPSSATRTSTEPESETMWSGIPPPAPFAPGKGYDSDSETRSSSRTGRSYISSGSTRSRKSYRTHDSRSCVDERYAPQDFYDPQLEEVADYLFDAMMRRFTGWSGQSAPMPRSPCDCASSDQMGPFSMASESAHGHAATVESRSSESIRTPEPHIDDKRALYPTQAKELEQEPLQPTASLPEESNSAEIQLYASPVILAIGPKTGKPEVTTEIDDSVALVNSLVENEMRHDNDASQDADLDTSFLENSVPVRDHTCIQM